MIVGTEAVKLVLEVDGFVFRQAIGTSFFAFAMTIDGGTDSIGDDADSVNETVVQHLGDKRRIRGKLGISGVQRRVSCGVDGDDMMDRKVVKRVVIKPEGD